MIRDLLFYLVDEVILEIEPTGWRLRQPVILIQFNIHDTNHLWRVNQLKLISSNDGGATALKSSSRTFFI